MLHRIPGIIGRLGTAARRNVGTGVGNLVEVLADGKLPALDASLLLNTPAAPSGIVVFALRQSAPTGWRMFDDGTIGAVGSGATYEAADAEFVFGELFAIASDANCPLLTSEGGATTRAAQTDAATAWAAGCRMSMPKALGRSLAVAGAGAGLTSRAVGQKVGEETHTPTLAELYAHSHDIDSGQTNGSANARRAASAADAPTGTTSTVGSSTPFNVIDPTVYLPAMVKL